MSEPTQRDTRINLHVYASKAGKPVYHVVHVGFFPHAMVARLVERLDAIGLAYRSTIADQSGIVDVMTRVMGPEPNPELRARRCAYEAPQAQEEAA